MRLKPKKPKPKPRGGKSRNVPSGAGRDRMMAIPKEATTREALNLLSPRILKLAPRFHPQFKAELA